MSRQRIYTGAVRAFSVAFIAIGLAVLAMTLANGGGPASLGFLLGLAFIGIGIGRLWAGARMSDGHE
ncbi:MAG TPA: hypothetical protein VFX35_08050 [Solirubrobacterales bacterium]|nr:hypothetical protein [Solirubrobacterales bacterium]